VNGNLLYNTEGQLVPCKDFPYKEIKEARVAKYKNLPFKRGHHVFGLNLSRWNIVKKDCVIIVEGQFDMISCFVNDINNVVALCGSKVGFEHVLLLKRYTNNFYVLFDNDEAGEKGWKALKMKSQKYGLNIKRITLPEKYKDVDQALKNFDKTWL
jgi:DNA primase